MNQQIIAIDLDDTIWESINPFIEWLNATYKEKKYKLSDFHTWDMENILGISQAEIVDRFRLYYQSDYFLHSQPFPSAVEAIRILAKKYYLVSITAREESARVQTVSHLHQYIPEIRKVYFSREYQGQHVIKAEICQDIGAYVLIDDNLGHLEDCYECGVYTMLYADTLWHKSQKDYIPSGCTLVDDWAHILKFLM